MSDTDGELATDTGMIRGLDHTDSVERHLHDALDHADDVDARHSIRHALQFLHASGDLE